MVIFNRGILKDSSFFFQMLILISTVIMGMIFGQYLFIGFAYLKSGFSVGDLNEFMSHVNGNAQLLRQSLFFQTVFAFFFPSLLIAYFFSDNTKEYLQTDQGFPGSVMLLTILSIIFVLPFLNATVYWSHQIAFPDSLKAIESKLIEWETQAQQLNNMILITDSYSDFLMNLLIVAVFAAVAEEFLFRGVLQNVFGKIFRNPHVVIWTVGIIFSIIHFQFYGFFARTFLGVYLGYLLYYTKSIWVPVLAHFTNNAIGVISYYSIKDPETFKKVDEVGTGSTSWLSLLSLCLFVVTVVVLIKKCKSQRLLS